MNLFGRKESSSRALGLRFSHSSLASTSPFRTRWGHRAPPTLAAKQVILETAATRTRALVLIPRAADATLRMNAILCTICIHKTQYHSNAFVMRHDGGAIHSRVALTCEIRSHKTRFVAHWQGPLILVSILVFGGRYKCKQTLHFVLFRLILKGQGRHYVLT